MQPDTEAAPMKLYPKAVIQEILRRVEEGEALVVILEGNSGYPSRQTFYRWITQDLDLSRAYANAVQKQISNRVYSTR